MKNTSPFLGPFAPLHILALPFIVYWMGYGAAWYWCKLRGCKLAPEFIELSVTVIAISSFIDVMMGGFKKYAQYRAKDIRDEEKRSRKIENIWMLMCAIFATIIVATGWLAIEVVRL